MPMPIGLAIGLILAGTAVKAQERKKTKKKVSRANEIMRARQDELSGDNRKIIMDRLEDYDPEARNEKQAAIEQETAAGMEAEYSPTLSLARGGGKITSQELSKRADRVKKDKLDLAKMIAINSAMRAPNDLRFKEAETMGYDEGRRGTIKAKARDYMDTDQQRLREASQGSDAMRLFGDILTTAGSYGAGSAIMGNTTLGTNAAPAAGSMTPNPQWRDVGKELARRGWR